MKKTYAIILVLAMAFSYVVPVKADEKISGISYNKRGTDSTLTIDTENAHSGKSSLKITNNSPEKSGRYLEITVPFAMEKGATYEYGFYAKAQKAVKQSVMIDWGTRHTLTPLSDTYNWTKFKYEYKNTGGDGSNIIRFIFDGTVDGFWIDDLYCYKVVNGIQTGENLVPNSGFEANGGDEDNADENGNMSSDDYFANLKDEKYIPIYRLDNVSIDGNIDEWDEISEICPDSVQMYSAGKGLPVDLKVAFKCAYDDEKFYFSAVTTDDVYNSFGGDTYWSGDCVQLAISKLTESYGKEFGFSWDAENNKPYSSRGTDGIEFAITTSGTKRIYETSFTWESVLGEKPESLLFSMCAGDNDGTDRKYAVQVKGGGIAEGKHNTNFMHLILMENALTPFMWLEGDKELFEKDKGSYRLHIVNPGEAQSFDVKIPNLGFEKTIELSQKSHHVEYIDKVMEKAGAYSLDIECPQTKFAYGFNLTVSPTKATYAKQIEEINAHITELENLMKDCEKNGITTDYEMVNLAILKRYIPIINADIDNKNTSRFDYVFRVLDNIYTEAKNNMNDYLSGAKVSVAATKPVTGNREIIGNTIWGDTETDGKKEHRPIFLVGYGHFNQAADDVGIFSNLGVNYIQQEVGPSTTVSSGGDIKDWLGGGTYESEGRTNTISISEEDTRSGKKSVKIKSDIPLTPNVYVSMLQPVIVEPGKTYEYGCYIKGKNINNVWMSAKNFDDRKMFPQNASDWTELKYEYTADNSGMVNLRLTSEGIVDSLYIDDFFVREKGSEVNLLKNSDFDAEGENDEYMGNVGGLAYFMNTVRNAEKNNVAISLLLAPHYFLDWVLQRYPETQARTPGTIHFRVDNDRVREIIKVHINTLLEQVKDSKAISDICLSNEPCYSPCANDYYQPLWEKYLKNEYGSIENLNEVYKESYSDFSEISMSKSPEPTVRNYDYRKFNEEIFADFHKWMADTVHEIAPNLPVHVKLMTGHFGSLAESELRFVNYGYNIEDFMEFTDVIGFDGGDSYKGGTFQVDKFIETSHLAHYSALDMQTSLKDVPAYNTEDHIVSDGSEEWLDEQAQHVGRHIWQGAIHGRGASAIWVWATTTSDNALKNSILCRPDCILEVGRSALDLNRLSYEITALKSAERDVGILYSYASQNYNYAYRDCSFKVYSGFIYSGKRPLFISENKTESLKDVKVLVVPNVTNTTSEAIDAIYEYLNNGGKVVIYGEDSLKNNEKNQPNDAEKLKSIFERSTVIPTEKSTYNITSPNAYEINDFIEKLVADNKLDVVKVVDANTGETPKNLEWTSGYYNGKLIVNICNYGDYDNIMNLNVYVRGKKTEKMKELRFNQSLGDIVSVDAGKPVLLEIDVPTTFNDTYGHWAENDITDMQNKGIVSGITEYKYAPDSTLTRAQWITLLMRTINRQGQYSGTISDINGHWAEKNIQNADSLGILEGMTSQGQFEPEKAVTREEMAKTIYLALKACGKSVTVQNTSFKDDDALKNKTEIASVCSLGILSGYPDNTFKGDRTLTRAEAAAALKNMLAQVNAD